MSLKDDMRDQVKGYLNRIGWNYDDSDGERLRFGVDLHCRLSSVRIRIKFSDVGYSVWSYLPIKASDDTMNEVMRYLMIANNRLRNGSFDMDLSDGEIYFRTYTHFQGLLVLPDEVIEESIMVSPATIDQFGDGLAAVAMGFSDAATEMEKLEARELSEDGDAE